MPRQTYYGWYLVAGLGVTTIVSYGISQYLFGVLRLSFDDATGPIHAEQDLQIRDFKTEQVWRFRMASPDRHSYKYQLTLFKADGSEVRVPPVETSVGVLVLQAQPTV